MILIFTIKIIKVYDCLILSYSLYGNEMFSTSDSEFIVCTFSIYVL